MVGDLLRKVVETEVKRCTAAVSFDNGFGGLMMLGCHRPEHPGELTHYDATVGIYWAYTGEGPPLAVKPDPVLVSDPMYTP